MNHNIEIASISKLLSANDIGITGAHQAGILIPKRDEILSFFPALDGQEKNPRDLLAFIDDDGRNWEFSFIYYNSLSFGGTRNEYRLTRMTKYIRSNNLKVGDELILTKLDGGFRRISFRRCVQQEPGKLRLSMEWKVVKI
jgi:hypothetical protein